MLEKVLLAPTTTAQNVEVVGYSGSAGLRPPTIIVDGLAGAEEVALQMQTGSGSWAALVKEGEAVVFSVDQNIWQLDLTGRYRLVKPSTAGAVSIKMYS